ncbi:hypothetical protein J6590_064762 [Homalodisca vitripennis]|nr:hypothetical protein J6590_064762 [Homalodisca vitripennis]
MIKLKSAGDSVTGTATHRLLGPAVALSTELYKTDVPSPTSGQTNSDHVTYFTLN